MCADAFVRDSFLSVKTPMHACISLKQDTLWAQATVSAHLQLFASLRGKSRVPTVTSANDKSVQEHEGGNRDVLHAVGLSSDRDREKRAGDLSVGMRRRLSTALALVGKPSVVVLDEPTAGLGEGVYVCV
jgi:ABC-type multidrug transport system ATPase subunit